jgi:hypothetical protein
VRVVADLLGEKERAEKILSGWEEGDSLVWTSRRDPFAQVGLGVVRFENVAAARAYFGFAIDLQRKKDTQLGSEGISLREVRISRGEQAVRSDGKRMFSPNGPLLPATFLLVRSGNLVLQWNWEAVPADVAWAERLLGNLLTQFEKTSGSVP